MSSDDDVANPTPHSYKRRETKEPSPQPSPKGRGSSPPPAVTQTFAIGLSDYSGYTDLARYLQLSQGGNAVFDGWMRRKDLHETSSLT